MLVYYIIFQLDIYLDIGTSFLALRKPRPLSIEFPRKQIARSVKLSHPCLLYNVSNIYLYILALIELSYNLKIVFTMSE